MYEFVELEGKRVKLIRMELEHSRDLYKCSKLCC